MTIQCPMNKLHIYISEIRKSTFFKKSRLKLIRVYAWVCSSTYSQIKGMSRDRTSLSVHAAALQRVSTQLWTKGVDVCRMPNTPWVTSSMLMRSHWIAKNSVLRSWRSLMLVFLLFSLSCIVASHHSSYPLFMISFCIVSSLAEVKRDEKRPCRQ